MKKLLIILVVFTIYVFAGCAESGSDYPRGYIDINSRKPLIPRSEKQIILHNGGVDFITCVDASTSDSKCNAVIINPRISDTNYIGLAVSDAHNGSTTKTLKIYCEGNTIPDTTNSILSNCTCIIKDGTNYATASFPTINIDSQPINDTPKTYQLYKITFKNDITIGTTPSYTIKAGDFITAQSL